MTAEEEQLLKQYLNVDGQDFEDWYLERFSSDEADREYKSVLAEAKAFEAGRARAYREIDAILDSRDHPAGCGCPPCNTIRQVAESLRKSQAASPGSGGHPSGPRLLLEFDQSYGIGDCG